MAKFISNDYKIELNSVDLSTSIASATLDITKEEQLTTAFGQTSVTRIAGLQDASLTLEFHQDFGTSAVDETLFPVLGSLVPFTITPTSEVASATNPEYSGTVLVTNYTPFDSATGELATFSITIPVSGDITRGTGA